MPRARAGRRNPEGGPSARRRHGYRDRLRDGRHSGPRHDRRNHAARPRVADPGLKEKLLAALRGGIKTVLIPEENAKDLVENRGQHQEWARDRSGVRTENAILIDYMTESPNVSGDDRSAILLPDAVRLAERRSLVLHPDGKEQGILSSE
jgi:Lon protease (S16) C-terminal proteolytic domain